MTVQDVIVELFKAAEIVGVPREQLVAALDEAGVGCVNLRTDGPEKNGG